VPGSTVGRFADLQYGRDQFLFFDAAGMDFVRIGARQTTLPTTGLTAPASTDQFLFYDHAGMDSARTNARRATIPATCLTASASAARLRTGAFLTVAGTLCFGAGRQRTYYNSCS